jgi:hypothetical protein
MILNIVIPFYDHSFKLEETRTLWTNDGAATLTFSLEMRSTCLPDLTHQNSVPPPKIVCYLERNRPSLVAHSGQLSPHRIRQVHTI